MSRNQNGVYYLPDGNPVSPGEVITAEWANSTMDDIAEALTNSLDRGGLGGMTGPLKISDGTSTTPGLGFTLEPNMGLYRKSTSTIGVTVAGADVAEINKNGITMMKGMSIVIPDEPTADNQAVNKAYVDGKTPSGAFVPVVGGQKGAALLPYGATADAPAGQGGMMRVDSELNAPVWFNPASGKWEEMGGSPIVVPKCDILAVAGGGSGGSGSGPAAYRCGGGGGAGGLKMLHAIPITPDMVVQITIGKGGKSVAAGPGINGTNTVVSGVVTVTGGGRGAAGREGTSQGPATTGGSGGGGAYSGGAPGIQGEGYNGGDSNGNPYTSGAGGGGAGGPAASATADGQRTAGGPGLGYDISGVSVTYAVGGNSSSNTPGSGGDGTPNQSDSPSGAGKDGIAIFSYQSDTQLLWGGTVTQANGRFIHTFTSDGKLYGSKPTTLTVPYLLVGGGGGSNHGDAYSGSSSGGQGGSITQGNATLIVGRTYPITVGAGGNGGGGGQQGAPGTPGGDTVLTADGGGTAKGGGTTGGGGQNGPINPIIGSTLGQLSGGNYYLCGWGAHGSDQDGQGQTPPGIGGGGAMDKPATPNTGGGGGGGAPSAPYGSYNPGMAGGSGGGILVIPTAFFTDNTTGTVTKTVVGDNTLLTFLTSGTYVA